ncbi:unnamed protein product [Musa hybrid cultivar]
MAEARKRVLVVGGSGYLGQHLLQGFSRGAGSERYALAFTHHRPSPPAELVDAVSPVLPFRVDLRTGDGFDAISTAFGQPDVVVNCAALSVPRTCEMDPAAAMSINLPSSLVYWLSSFKNNNSLLIHLSTDQVYEGVRSFYKEDDEALPVNMYGKTKIAAEKHIIANCSNYAILRSSIIYGPQTISPVTKSLPIQWIDSALKQGQEVEFFHDEFRCPVYVKDVVNVIIALSKKWISDGKQMQLLLNVGGPNRVSRFQMAETVARIRGYNHSLIKSVSASSVNRGVISPSDISMDISILIRKFFPLGVHWGASAPTAKTKWITRVTLVIVIIVKGFHLYLNSDLMFPLLPQRIDLRSSRSMRAVVPSIRDGGQELVGHLGIVQENPPPSPPSEQEAVRGSLLLADPVPECRTLAGMLEGEDLSSQSLPPSQSPNIPQLFLSLFFSAVTILREFMGLGLVCTQHPFQRVQLHHVCEKHFGWSPDKTDQYILPKIAERDLRRFANLRSTSSELGARIPLHMMPVPCPVSAIVKLRKVQGQDYYEVSWQGIDGLGNSIVPADLIESACPERIAEYVEKKAEVKQQNRKPRRLTKALVNQIDLQLQGLLLSIESQSKTLPETANCLPPPSAAPEVIDLCSPSPPLRACQVAKCQKSIDMHVNVIDIHESDNDASPEHERKARELRLFIDSIREDLY